MARLFLVLLCALIDSAPAQAVALNRVAEATVQMLAPHRAVYDISLADRKEGVSVSGVTGRMVFELTGSPCEGYTQNIRMVTRVADEEGKETYSDLRSSTWEKADGERFRFTSSHYFNDALQDIVSGTATHSRKKNNISIRLKRPSDTMLTVDGDVLFPTQHSLAILKSAQKGERLLKARIYDGSEQGQVVYHTVAFIGDMKPAGNAEAKTEASGGGSDRKSNKAEHASLDNLVSWPVAVSYYDQIGKGDTTPSYELSFRLYPNGVSRNLLINYGEFAVRGKLDSLTYLRAGACK